MEAKDLRILVIGNRMPWPLKDGGAMATFGMLEALKACGANLTYFSYNTKKHWVNETLFAQQIPGIQVVSVPLNANPSAPQALLNLLSGKSYHLQRYQNAQATQRLKTHLQSQAPYHGIIVEGLYSVPLIAPLLQSDLLKTTPVAFRSHNVEHQIWQRVVENSTAGIKKWYLNLQARRLRNEELELWKQFHWHFPITPNDAQAIAAAKGIDASDPHIVLYQPGYQQLPPPINLSESAHSQSLRCFHIGSMEWEANVQAVDWFVKSVWPAVLAQQTQATFHVAGKGLKAQDPRFQAPGVVVHGEVADARDFMRENGVCVVPLLAGSGIRMKILEAMALGLPVLTTTVGIQGIQVQPQVEIAVADGATAFSQALAQLLASPEKQKELALAARVFIEKNHDAKLQTQQLLDRFLMA